MKSSLPLDFCSSVYIHIWRCDYLLGRSILCAWLAHFAENILLNPTEVLITKTGLQACKIQWGNSADIRASDLKFGQGFEQYGRITQVHFWTVILTVEDQSSFWLLICNRISHLGLPKLRNWETLPPKEADQTRHDYMLQQIKGNCLKYIKPPCNKLLSK